MPHTITPTTTRQEDEAAVRNAAQAVYSSANTGPFVRNAAADRHTSLLAAFHDKWGGTLPGRSGGSTAGNRVQHPWRAHRTSVPSVTSRD